MSLSQRLTQFLLLACALLTTHTTWATSAEPTELRISYGDSYKPFAWIDQGKIRGIQVDFVDAVLVERLGLKVKHEGCPWKRCQLRVKNGQSDGFFTVPTEQRAEYTQHTVIPFYETNFVMHTARDNLKRDVLQQVTSLDSLRTLHSLRHVHMHGSGWHEQVLRDMKQVKATPDARQIPYILASHRADIYIEQAEMFKYQAKEAGLSDKILTLDEPVLRRLGWHLFIGHQSGRSEVLENINRELIRLQESGELSEIKQAIFANYGL